MKGFTLIELLVSVALFIFLSTMAVASYSYLIHKNEQQIIIDALRTAVQYAKIQALSLGKPVFLTAIDGSTNWANGALLLTSNEKTNKSELLYQWQWHHPRWHLSWCGARSSEKIIFSNNPLTAMSNGRFTLLNVDTQERSELILNRLGRVKVANKDTVSRFSCSD